MIELPVSLRLNLHLAKVYQALVQIDLVKDNFFAVAQELGHKALVPLLALLLLFLDPVVIELVDIPVLAIWNLQADAQIDLLRIVDCRTLLALYTCAQLALEHILDERVVHVAVLEISSAV